MLWHRLGILLAMLWGRLFVGFFIDLPPFPLEYRGINIQDCFGSRFPRGECFQNPIFSTFGGRGGGPAVPVFPLKGLSGSLPLF